MSYELAENLEDRIFKTELAKENWKTKYRFRDETPLQTQLRLSKHCASIEKEPEKWEKIFFNTLVDVVEDNGKIIADGLKCTFGGRITANLGTTYSKTTLLNCYISGPISKASIKYNRINPFTKENIPIEINTQDSKDSLANIMLCILEQAETLKSEGGYGINFDFIRPRGSLIKGVGIRHPGVVSYMKIWDSVSETIVKGEDGDGYRDELTNHHSSSQERSHDEKVMARKGAMMGCLTSSHPDIEEFIRAKQKPGSLTKFNISVVIDDKLMEAVVNDDFYDLHFEGIIHKRVKARELYDLIMKSTYNRAEPGVLFKENMQKNNPIAYLGETNAVNPCGEVVGQPDITTTCLLGSINLTRYVKNDRTFDFDKFEKDSRVFARMLDNINDLTYTPLPSYDWAVKNVRQYGMGINGLGSALLMMGIPYNSQEALDFTQRISFLRENSIWQESAKLAVEKGKFPAYDKTGFETTNWFINFSQLSEETRHLIVENGVRNGKCSTNAPLGNSSVQCDMISNGIEPIFSFFFDRKIIEAKWPSGLTEKKIRKEFDLRVEGEAEVWYGEFNGEQYYYEPHNRGLCRIERVCDYGYNWVLENFPDDIKDNKSYLVNTENINTEDHLNIQEIIQKNVSQSVSKTVNVPHHYPFEDFKNLYLDAWKRGLIGITTYRDKTMESVLSRVGEEYGINIEEQPEEEIEKPCNLDFSSGS